MFIGSQKELVTAFLEARWFEADSLNAGSAMKVVQATMRQSGYAGAPVSALLINNRPPDLVFQKSLNTFAKRHHVRIWKLGKTIPGTGRMGRCGDARYRNHQQSSQHKVVPSHRSAY